MINAVLKITKDGLYSGFEVKGHAGKAPYGKDIVCAAVSTAVQMALIGIDEVAGVKNTYVIRDAYIKCDIPQNLSDEQSLRVQALVSAMHLCIKSIEEQYQDFVQVKED